ncbi:WAS/WASL-interacting protein family member 2 isoform X1 [Pleuronectes platessa]|uniref:WAS/WASL-interacting protein family member 2 isoform X1 n=1 Tax=Pleuronectes platessa TaxID=8262 RepID=UPI00232A3C46|nr:WAS/WASL-interacting protein family member 2 isoform X1 [Pleuronectes platessa]XP_053298468.1 WAS/WASL-interacting protein family member 2 isoform X1 [Pleuronectes platessa]
MPLPPPGGPLPPPTVSQANTIPPKLNREEVKGRGALLSDIAKSTKLRNVSVVNDCSAPLLDSKIQTPKSQSPSTEHPYIRLYQYLHQQPSLQGAASEEQKKMADEERSALSLEKPKRGGALTGGANGSGEASPSGSVPPIGGLFSGEVPKPRPVGDGSSGRLPPTRAAAPRPPSHHHDNAESPSPQALSPSETSGSQHPSLPNLSSSPSPSSAASSPSTSMKHSSSAPPPPPPLCRRGNAPSPPNSSHNREKPLPLAQSSTPPLPSKPPPSPGNSRRPPTSGGNSPSSTPSSSLAPPPLSYRINNGLTSSGAEVAPELPQRHNSLSNRRPAPSPGGPTPTRGPAPPPPPASPTPSQQGSNRPAPLVREAPGRGAAPPVPVQSSSSRAASREAPPPPPYRIHGSPSLSSDPHTRGKPPPPPTRNPAAPPPPLRNGHSSSIPHSFVDDFESKYSFHPLDDFPPPDEFRHFTKFYPSRANTVMRGAPPLPPVGR